MLIVIIIPDIQLFYNLLKYTDFYSQLCRHLKELCVVLVGQTRQSTARLPSVVIRL